MKLNSIIKTDTTYRKKTILAIFAILLIITSVLSSSSDISSGELGNIISFTIYLMFLCIFFFAYKKFTIPKTPMWAFIAIYTIFIIGFIRDTTGLINHPSSYTYPASDVHLLIHTGETIGFIIASITLVFFIPKVIPRDWFFISIAYISTFSILLGVPAYIIGDYSVFGVSIDTYTALDPLRQYGIQIPALASVWGDANAMSKMAIAGVFGSHYLYARHQSSSYLFLLVVNLFGLFLANSRMAIISLIIAYSVYAVYKSLGEIRTVAYLGISGIIGSVIFLLIVFGTGRYDFIPVGEFSGRVALWRASADLFFEFPLTGIGIHNVGETVSVYTGASPIAPQNSYLRVFVAGGVVGGGLYIWLIMSSVFKYISEVESTADLLTLCLLITFTLVQFTDTAHPFGINKNAMVFAITLGYIIDQIYQPKI